MSDPLRVRVEAVWHALRAQDGDLGVSRAAFCAHVSETISQRVADGAEPEEALERLVLPDVYLVLGCLGGSDRALRLFLKRFGGYLRHLSHRDAPSAAIGDDVEAQLLATLFTPRHRDDPHSARLSSYRGLGTLQGWLRVTARRLVIDIMRRQRPRADQGTLDRLPASGRTDVTLERLEAAARLRPVFAGCVAALSEAERTLLRQYYRDGRVLREIGADLGIDTSSAFRRIGTARKKVWRRFRTRALAELGLDDRDLKRLLGALAAELDLDDLFATALVLLAL